MLRGKVDGVNSSIKKKLRVKTKEIMAELSTKTTSRAPASFDVIDNNNNKIAENKFGPIRETDPSNIAEIQNCLKEDGYVLLRGFLDSVQVRDASTSVQTFLSQKFKGKRGVLLTGCKEVTHSAVMSKVTEAPALHGLFRKFFRAPARCFDTKWLRSTACGQFTTAHSDAFFFRGHLHTQMYTCWIPLGDVDYGDGPLVLCPGSHKVRGYERFRPDELPTGLHLFLRQPSTHWVTTSFKAGDVVIFDIKTVHASLPNTNASSRISVDTRWLPVSSEEDSAIHMSK